MAVLDSGAAANLVSIKWSEHRNKISERWGIQRAETFPRRAQFKSGDGRLGEVRCAADIPVGTAGKRGTFAALVPEANILALLREGALEALGGRLDFCCDIVKLRQQWVDIPLK